MIQLKRCYVFAGSAAEDSGLSSVSFDKCSRYSSGISSVWPYKHKEFYFTSIQAGLAGDNQHMERLIKDVMDAQQ